MSDRDELLSNGWSPESVGELWAAEALSVVFAVVSADEATTRMTTKQSLATATSPLS